MNQLPSLETRCVLFHVGKRLGCCSLKRHVDVDGGEQATLLGDVRRGVLQEGLGTDHQRQDRVIYLRILLISSFSRTRHKCDALNAGGNVANVHSGILIQAQIVFWAIVIVEG